MGPEEGNIAGDEDFNSLAQYEALSIQKEAELAKRVVAQYVKCRHDLWKANRIVTSGIATRKAINLDFEDESESAVHILVHDLRPPFLDGRIVFIIKKDSALVKEKCEQVERQKAAAKLALGGTSLGKNMGVKDEDAVAEAEQGQEGLQGFFVSNRAWFYKRAELETEMARQQKETAQRAAEEALGIKTASGSALELEVRRSWCLVHPDISGATV
ncbi:hypothetical protein BDY19DRAFT_992711 [Irpex rosettiformis]|uniref:Uncharacterized protein n=1 Tax=Irpex rosettiformis TaxID=378272 RepID=A0ACB8U6Z9_9APHY|nr:hypothetical protein BDY19DRAFT_992711 [Irpex rosettiformis]